jgi:hypothetical protein
MSKRQLRSRIIVLLLSCGIAPAQDIFSYYSQYDPLSGQPETTSTTGTPQGSRCVPPDPQWQLVLQEQNTCYWYAPFAQKLSGYVVPMNAIASVESQGGRCSVNPFSDPTGPNPTAICNRQPPNQQTPPSGGEDNGAAPPGNAAGSTPGPGAGNPPATGDVFSTLNGGPDATVNDFRDLIASASPRQASALAGRAQQDMSACGAFVQQGVLSRACCTDLSQAFNFRLEGTGPARAIASSYQAAAARDCQSHGAPSSGTPAIYTVPGQPSPALVADILAKHPNCQKYTATQVICQGTPPDGLSPDIPWTTVQDGSSGSPGSPPKKPPTWQAGVPKLDTRPPLTRRSGSNMLQGGASESHAGGGLGRYAPDYGMSLPAMIGKVRLNGVTITITTKAGHHVGDGINGAVGTNSQPPVYSQAQGFFTSADTFHITQLFDRQNRQVLPEGGINVTMMKQRTR